MNTRTLEIIDKCIDMFATTHLEREGRQPKTYRRINKSKIIGVESQEIEADTYQSIAFLKISEILTFFRVCGGAVNISQCSHAPNLLSLRAAERNGTTKHLFYWIKYRHLALWFQWHKPNHFSILFRSKDFLWIRLRDDDWWWWVDLCRIAQCTIVDGSDTKRCETVL